MANLSKAEWLALEKKALELRKLCVQTTVWAGSGHFGGGMSVMDLLTVLYHKYLNIKVDEPQWDDRDRFILSKGHAAIAYAPVLCDKGFNPVEMLKSFNLSGSKMGMHLDSNKVVGVDASTGSLGHGPSIAAGTALTARLQNKDFLTYVVTGDGELGEGSCWEGFMTINHYNLSNCIVFIDRNHNMIDGNTEDVMKLEPLADKMTAFGFNTIVVDGNNIGELCDAIDVAIERAKTPQAPTCILMDTKKGAGIKSIEGDYTWHYGAIDDALFEKFNNELDADYAARVARAEKEGK